MRTRFILQYALLMVPELAFGEITVIEVMPMRHSKQFQVSTKEAGEKVEFRVVSFLPAREATRAQVLFKGYEDHGVETREIGVEGKRTEETTVYEFELRRALVPYAVFRLFRQSADAQGHATPAEDCFRFKLSVFEGAEEIKALPGLSPETIDKLAELAGRLHDPENQNYPLGPQPRERISPRKELGRFCTVDDLVSITALGRRHLTLWDSAFGLLSSERYSAQLTEGHIARLARYFMSQREEWYGKDHRTARVLGRNKEFGVPALKELLVSEAGTYTRVNAAGGLMVCTSPLDLEMKRKAQTVLLEGLAIDGETGRLAHNYIPKLEPWMAEWLVTKLRKPKPPDALRYHGIGKLAYYEGPELKTERREIFLKGLRDASRAVRSNSVHGLLHLGLKEADMGIYERIMQDPSVVCGMCDPLRKAKAPWTAPLLLKVLDAIPSGDESCRLHCAKALVEMKYKPCLPKLMALLSGARGHDPGYILLYGWAIMDLAGLRGRFFVDRPVDYVEYSKWAEKESAALLAWWEQEGRKKHESGE